MPSLNVSSRKTFTSEELRKLVMSFTAGCEDGKKKFLQANNIAPNRVNKTYTVTFEWDEGSSRFHTYSTKSIEEAIMRGLADDNRGHGNMMQEKNVTVRIKNT